VYLHNPYYFMYATLMDESGERELNTLSDKKARTMTGSVVASLAHLKDIDGNDGAFFVFPDLSVRCEGVYRLKFSLFEIVGNQIFFCKSITSDSFTVYSAKKFPGMEESTRLTKLFAEQGLKIRVRKEQKST
ncbi:Spore development regulator umv1, partial [Coemansia sp. S17]